MMAIAKYISENKIEKFPGYFEENGMIYTNNDAVDKALLSGEWNEFITDEQPEYNSETHHLIPYYEMIDSVIHKKWQVEDNIEPESEEYLW